MPTPAGLNQPGPTFALCSDLLASGGEIGLSTEPIATDVLRVEYRDLFAAEADRPDSAPTVGFEEAVERLSIAPQNALRVGHVTHPHEPWLFVVFIDPDSESVVTCFGINHPDATPEKPFPVAGRRADR